MIIVNDLLNTTLTRSANLLHQAKNNAENLSCEGSSGGNKTGKLVVRWENYSVALISN